MTRTAPLLTLVAVALTGGALLTTNYLSTPAPPAPVPVVASAGAVPEPAGPGATVPEPAAPAPAAPDEETAAPAAPAEEPAADPAEGTTYAGWTTGMGFTVALAVTGEDVVAYVCDGEDVEVWLNGTLTDGDLTLQNADGSATLTGTADADGAAGTVERDGAEWSFTAEPMDAEEAATAGRGDVRQVAERAANRTAADPAAEEPAAEEPAAEEPAAEEPAAEEPAAEYPGSEY